jgi:hypothetical protein
MIDEPLSELGCRIYVEASSGPRELAEFLSQGETAEVSSRPVSLVIKSEIGELEIRRNEDHDTRAAREYPDGFLYFRYALEFYPRRGVSHEDQVKYVGTLLDRLWSSGFPAVASCDYEDELPHRGVYRDASLPWPSSVLNAMKDAPTGLLLGRGSSTGPSRRG